MHPQFTFLQLVLVLTCVVLSIPALIFLGGYVQIQVSICFFLLFFFLTWWQTRNRFFFLLKSFYKAAILGLNNYKNLVIVATLSSLAWMLISGSGGVGFQHNDHKMNDVMLYHLMHDDWPVIFSSKYLGVKFASTAQPLPLVYYIGHFLPASLIGKLFGWTAANIAVFAWTWLELWLFFLLAGLYALPKVTSFRTYVLFLGLLMFTSGAGYIASSIHKIINPAVIYGPENAMIWSFPLLFTSHIRLLLWAPQHTMGAWLLILVIMHQLRTEFGLRWLGLPVVSSMLCSPFAVLGAFPFLVVWLLKIIKSHQMKMVFSPFNLVIGGLSLLCITTYITSNSFSFPIVFLPEIWGKKNFLVRDALFLFVELGGIATILWFSRHSINSQERWLILIAFLSLIGITFFQIGLWNDWCARASISAIMMLGVFVARQVVIRKNANFSWKTLLFYGILLLNVLTPVTTDLANSLINYQVKTPPHRDFMSPSDDFVKQQRLGTMESVFFKYLARKN